MRKTTIAIWCLLVSLSVYSCREEQVLIDSEEKAAFLMSTAPGYYPDGNALFIYKDSLHQKSINTQRGMYRFQTNEQDTCLNMVFESVPRNVGVQIVTEINYYDPQNKVSHTVMLECSQVRDGKIWFWEPQTKTGILIHSNMQ